MTGRVVLEVFAISLVIVVTLYISWRIWSRGADVPAPPATKRSDERKVLSVDLSDRDP